MPSKNRSNLGSRKGLSLPLATGLVTLLMVASMAANELIIRTIRSVRGVESSNRAYFAAEAGIEDGLYELSPHLAGYQTPALGESDVRHGEFVGQGRWNNRWAIESKSATPSWSGKIFKNQKLVLSLFDDKTSNALPEPSANAIDSTAINPVIDIANLRPDNFEITFTLPESLKQLLANGNILMVDNDEDGQPNEDEGGVPDSTLICPGSGLANKNPLDNDCDGKVNEDGNENPVVLWKLFDNTGRSLIPSKGCLSAAGGGSEFCEKDFQKTGDPATNYAIALNQDRVGINELGAPQTIKSFISSSDPSARLQFEFVLVIPMRAINPSQTSQSFEIPYFDYGVNSVAPDNRVIPFPYFTVNSDGYFGAYKQSISTTVTPKTTIPLFDFTIIQQQ